MPAPRLSQPYFAAAADRWFLDAEHVVWDGRTTPAAETRPEVVQAAFRRAVAQLRKRQGDRPEAWRWGRLHGLEIAHPFGASGRFAGFFNLPRTEGPGALDSVWKSHFNLGDPQNPFRAIAGPVCRLIMDLGDLSHAWWVLDTGASGWPGSPHYGDQHALWQRVEYLPMVMDWEAIRASAAGVVTLK
jgi:penicillin amidase